jgi:hypothetical protein
MFTRVLAALALLFAAPATAAPALWKVADADTTIYLFGTVHMLPRGTEWFGEPAKSAFAKSDTLVLEVLLPTDPRVVAQTMMKRGISANLPPLADRVPPPQRERLERAVADAGMPRDVVPNMETWLVALTLASAQLSKMSFDGGEGVETKLRAAAGTKKQIGLETLDQQFGFFDGLPEADQRAMLAATLDDLAGTETKMRDMVGAWQRGDVERLAADLNEEMAATPTLRDVLLSQRNARWADWVKTRLATPGTVFVAVGAGHLGGADSVQAMLAKRGLKVERVR